MIAWFFATKIGRWLGAAGAILIAISLLLLRAFSAGKASERAKQDKASLKNLRNRIDTDDTVSKLPQSDVDRDLSSWLSDDKR